VTVMMQYSIIMKIMSIMKVEKEDEKVKAR
jgi:hypothetical protein